mmetsp:Transcript_33658/g.78618  ORF Transcript_33658/g.78618 Transcript_33658/m.78618 type:complete len:242 (-) Transcript_33658:357-1082(-)
MDTGGPSGAHAPLGPEDPALADVLEYKVRLRLREIVAHFLEIRVVVVLGEPLAPRILQFCERDAVRRVSVDAASEGLLSVVGFAAADQRVRHEPVVGVVGGAQHARHTHARQAQDEPWREVVAFVEVGKDPAGLACVQLLREAHAEPLIQAVDLEVVFLERGALAHGRNRMRLDLLTHDLNLHLAPPLHGGGRVMQNLTVGAERPIDWEVGPGCEVRAEAVVPGEVTWGIPPQDDVCGALA